MQSTIKSKARAGGPATERTRHALGINLGVARRELRNAAKRADLLMQAGDLGAADKHQAVMEAIAILDDAEQS